MFSFYLSKWLEETKGYSSHKMTNRDMIYTRISMFAGYVAIFNSVLQASLLYPEDYLENNLFSRGHPVLRFGLVFSVKG